MAPAVTTVEVLGQLAGAAWSIIGVLNLMAKRKTTLPLKISGCGAKII